MAAPSKTVCLRAFNEGLDVGNPWESKSAPPPPVPKRIAWPGGKIVSNKDEALASFLRRKLDQGQALTPEQMAMLEKMVDPGLTNGAPTSASRALVTGNRKKNGRGGGVRWRGNGNHKDSGAGTTTAAADARILLHKLEHKVATASSPQDFQVDGVGNFQDFDFALSSRRGRRKVDLSSLKRNQAGGRGGLVSRKLSKLSVARDRARTREEGGVQGGGGGGRGGRGRRVISDGHGGFVFAIASSELDAERPPLEVRQQQQQQQEQEQHQQQQQRQQQPGKVNKRARVVPGGHGDDTAWSQEAGAGRGGEGRSGRGGAGGSSAARRGRFGGATLAPKVFGNGVTAATSAAVAAATPAMDRDAEVVAGVAKVGGVGRRRGKKQAAVAGAGDGAGSAASLQGQGKAWGKGGKKGSVVNAGGGGRSGGGGDRGDVVAGEKGGVRGGGGLKRSLEDLMSGGLAASRR